ncbi:ABC transporter permease [Spiroplasma floricola]|uniref:Ribose/galactose ABC transporter permease n=1 Tax=Spiroplasma floricola 23-6 TaxID=1336749 RepID=A0A2K8SDD2_9MOLU|nr:hypothetical protein [Spiroplasma floricola]AUB31433.1 ribose/galactose ABC transporter permease [Spiroplasma floricola 23-6]
MDFKLNRWLRNQKIKSNLINEKNLVKLNYFKSSVIAILIGLFMGAIIVFAQNFNGLSFIFTSFGYSFDSDTIDETLNYFTVFIFMGLGLALGFKVGLFNMGGSGQAILGMALAIAIIGAKAKAEGLTDIKYIDKNFIIVIFLVFILSGVLISTMAGLFKVFFNIHEVVTTVMLNWIVWYLARWMLLDTKLGWPEYSKEPNHASPSLNPDWLSIGDNNWILGIILSLLSVSIIYLLLKFTTFGYKFKVVGKQPQAAMYAGIKNRQYLILTTALQGLFIGLGAVFYWVNIKKRMTVNTTDLPSIGFDAIPVALVAFNNVLAIVPIALIWATLKAGSDRAIGVDFIGLSTETPSLIFGIIIYSSAIYILFLKFSPIEKIKTYLFELKCSIYQDLKLESNIKISAIKKEMRTIFSRNDILEIKEQIEKQKSELRSLKEKNKKSLKNETEINSNSKEQILVKEEFIKKLELQLKEEINNYVGIYKSKTKMIKGELLLNRKSLLEEYENNSYKGLNKKVKNELSLKYFSIMDQFVLMQIERNELVKNLKRELKLTKELDSRNNIKEQIKETRVSYDKKAKDIINEYNKLKKSKFEKLKEAQREAKLYLNEINIKFEDVLKNSKLDNKTESLEISKIKDNINIVENKLKSINLDKEQKETLNSELSHLKLDLKSEVYKNSMNNKRNNLKLKIEKYKQELEVVDKYGC